TRCRQIQAPDRGAERAALILGEGFSLQLRLEQPIHFGERNVDGYRDIDSALLDLRDELQLRRERAIGLGLVGHDPRLRLDADGQRERSAANVWLPGEGPRGVKLQP